MLIPTKPTAVTTIYPLPDSATTRPLIESHSPARGRWRLTQTWLTLEPRPESALLAAVMTFCLALASLMYWGNVLGARVWMAATGKTVFQDHQYYQLWTSLFAHADAGHLASNSFLFFILSYFLYGYFGAWVSPLAAFLVSGMANWFVLKGYDPETTLVGASGVVYWMGGAWLVFYFALNRQKSLGTRLVRSLGVAFLIFMPAEAFKASTSYSAHFYGFLGGVAFAAAYFQFHKRKFRSVERRLFEVDDDALEPVDEADSVSLVNSSTESAAELVTESMTQSKIYVQRADRFGSGFEREIVQEFM